MTSYHVTGVKQFTVGIGQEQDLVDLSNIAGGLMNHYYIRLDDFTSLQTNLTTISSAVCRNMGKYNHFRWT